MTSGRASISSLGGNRAYALDALRGLAILAMLLSAQVPFDRNALPSWMYHAQNPPPLFTLDAALPGITWVDLVFPFFLFSLGAALPLALARRMKPGIPRWRLGWFILERGLLLGFFAFFVEAIRPDILSAHPAGATYWLALGGFVILFPILTRLPVGWPAPVRSIVRAVGWAGAVLYVWLVRYPDGGGFKLERSDIIIVVLANMAVFGAIAWIFTRHQLLPRLGLLGILFAIRLSNLPEPVTGWVHDVWAFSPAPWIYKLYYLQYLFIVIPGTIAGDLIRDWIRDREATESAAFGSPDPKWRTIMLGIVMSSLVIILLVGLKTRWLVGATVLTFALCGLGAWLLAKPTDATGRLHQRLFLWAVYWLVLGLIFEPYEGGIKKSHATLSYYFVSTGLALCTLIGFSVITDVLNRRRWLRILIENGQNPMIAYAGINSLVIPVLALSGAAGWLDRFTTSPWRGFGRGVLVTLLMAFTVSFLTRRRIFWRT